MFNTSSYVCSVCCFGVALTFWRTAVGIVVRVRVIKIVAVRGGKTTGIDEVLIGLTLAGCCRSRYI